MLDRKENIVPELLKRLKAKQLGVVNFCLHVLITAIGERNVTAEDINLKMVFKST
jgi:hypothetical protein